MSKLKTILWFRRDLRISDNPALLHALESSSEVLPIYIHAPEEEHPWIIGGATKWWLHHSLISLKDQLGKLGLDLKIFSGPSFSVLSKLVDEGSFDQILWNRLYEKNLIERDTKIKDYFLTKNKLVKSFKSNLLMEPWEIKNKSNLPFKVFTPFYRELFRRYEHSAPVECLPNSDVKTISFNAASLKIEDLELLPKINWDLEFYKTWEPGEIGAKKALEEFTGKEFVGNKFVGDNFIGKKVAETLPEKSADKLGGKLADRKLDGRLLGEKAITNYSEARNLPNIKGTSRLSPHLHFGEISPRQIWDHVISRVEQVNDPIGKSGHETFLREVGWREFAHHLLFHFPETDLKPLYPQYANFGWRSSSEDLALWQRGLTGVPIVDAGMRELWQTGWMHNRVRMIVASFLVKHLLIEWQEGARWFWDTLVDADLAQNTLGWQWTAGCGADAAPYYRVFNPVLQGEKFDKNGEYVRRYVPELSELPNKYIHQPWEAPEEILLKAGIVLGQNYPQPMVDLREGRERALIAFSKLKKAT